MTAASRGEPPDVRIGAPDVKIGWIAVPAALLISGCARGGPEADEGLVGGRAVAGKKLGARDVLTR